MCGVGKKLANVNRVNFLNICDLFDRDSVMNGLIKKTLIFLAVMLLVATSGWYGRKFYKHTVEQRLLLQARQSIEKKDWRAADLCLQRVIQINPLSVEASKLVADRLSDTGSPDELSWRIQVTKLEPNNVTNHILWAKAAFKIKNFASASEALAGVDNQSKATAEYHKIDGAVAWGMGDAVEAEKQYLEALRLEPSDNASVLNLATIHLSSTNQAILKAARASLVLLTTNVSFRIPALHLLLTDASKFKSLPDAITYSREIANDSSATFEDKITYLQLLKAANSDDYASWRASLEKAAVGLPRDVFALGRCLAVIENPATALHWLQALPPQIQTNLPVPFIIADCQISLKDWSGLLTLVNQQDWGDWKFYQFALKSLAQRSLDRTMESESCWQKAFLLAEDRLVSLSELARVTGVWGWNAERIQVLNKIIDKFPQATWAVTQLTSQLYLDGNTRELVVLLSKIQSANPTDPHLKNNLACLLMLRKSDLDKAYRLAKEAFETSTNDPFFISTYSYSLLLQGKSDEALKLSSNINPEYLKNPSIAAYYGVIQAETGHKTMARACLSFAETGKLLPEEKQMIQLANARL